MDKLNTVLQIARKPQYLCLAGAIKTGLFAKGLQEKVLDVLNGISSLHYMEVSKLILLYLKPNLNYNIPSKIFTEFFDWTYPLETHYAQAKIMVDNFDPEDKEEKKEALSTALYKATQAMLEDWWLEEDNRPPRNYPKIKAILELLVDAGAKNPRAYNLIKAKVEIPQDIKDLLDPSL